MAITSVTARVRVDDLAAAVPSTRPSPVRPRAAVQHPDGAVFEYVGQ